MFDHRSVTKKYFKLQMGFQELVEGRLRSSYGYEYERLTTQAARSRSWMKKRLIKGLRLSRPRKLILKLNKGFSLVLFPKRVVRMYTDVVNRMMVDDDGMCPTPTPTPTIIFSSQWGLPVLSHSRVLKSRKRERYRHQ